LILKGIILHGGHGTRLRPLTHTGPKQLIPVANKPISQYVLEDLIEARVEEIAIVSGGMHVEKVKRYYGDGSSFNSKISYFHQSKPKGIAHAIELCKEFIENESFIVYLGDNIIKGGIKEFVEIFKTSNYDAMVLLCEVKTPQHFGVAKFDAKGKLVSLVEKPKHPPSNYALTGIYLFNPSIFKMIKRLKPSWRGELEITEAIQLLLENGYNVGHRFVNGWWKDTGTPEDILEVNRLILDELKYPPNEKIEENHIIQGRVSIGENTTISKNAMIRGPAIIGKNTIIENNVYIGPYTSIGNDVIMKSGEIENSIIMDNSQIDVNDRIIDSLIAPNSKIISNNNNKPRGRRFLLGEGSYLEL
jgi:glucose-1-phosphate thymidylyltransferase|tara:strand:- start:2495 stop:3574 length:1080 start_codon:yes stop_codon:yes gene_type:complete